MFIVTICVLGVGLLLMRLCDQYLINPVTITSSLWIILLTIYNTINHGLYPLSDRFYIALLCWYIPFFIFFWVACLLPSISRMSYIRNAPLSFLYNKKLMWFFIAALSIIVILKVWDVQQFSPMEFYRGIRQLALARSRGEIENVPSYMIQLNRICQFSYVLMLIYFYKDIKLRGRYIFYMLVVLYILLGANKFIIAKVILAIIVLRAYQGKFSLPRLLMLVSVVVIVFYLLEILRRGSSSEDLDLLSFVYIYILTPLPAFDSYILHSSSGMLFTSLDYGHHVFANLLGSLEINPDYFENENAVFVPLPTNVFTMMSSYYIDWKWTGLMWGGMLYGLVFGYIYARSFYSEPFKILYASLAYILIFQSFFDYLLTQQSHFNLSLILVMFLFFYHPQLYVKKE